MAESTVDLAVVQAPSFVTLSEAKFLQLVKSLEESLTENKELLKKKRRRRKAAWKKRNQQVDVDDIIWGSEEQSQKWSEKIIEDTVTSVPVVTGRDPVCLVSYGPPGSGKSTFVYKIAEKRQLNCVEVNVDMIVRDYIAKVLKKPQLFHDQDNYMKIRMGWPEKVRMAIIQRCFETKRDILIETTGRNCDVADTVISPSLEYNYEPLVVYVLVPFIDLVSRVMLREKKTKQSHPPFSALLQMCKLAASNVSRFREACGAKGRVIYVSNCKLEGEAIELENAADLVRVFRDHGFIDSVKKGILLSLPLNTI